MSYPAKSKKGCDSIESVWCRRGHGRNRRIDERTLTHWQGVEDSATKQTTFAMDQVDPEQQWWSTRTRGRRKYGRRFHGKRSIRKRRLCLLAGATELYESFLLDCVHGRCWFGHFSASGVSAIPGTDIGSYECRRHNSTLSCRTRSLSTRQKGWRATTQGHIAMWRRSPKAIQSQSTHLLLSTLLGLQACKHLCSSHWSRVRWDRLHQLQ